MITSFERASRIYQMLERYLKTYELFDHHIASIKAEIDDAISAERYKCIDIAENYYRSHTDLLHGEMTKHDQVVGINIARLLRERFYKPN